MSIALEHTADCEREIAALLADLSEAQDELLSVLKSKREALSTSDAAALEKIENREAGVVVRLQACQDRRAKLLASAEAASMAELSASLPAGKTSPLSRQVRQASAKMRIVQNHALTNWVIAQRSLLHLSQLLAIIASGGRLTPTYGGPAAFHSRGALVDQEG